jgi:hypothetical protein
MNARLGILVLGLLAGGCVVPTLAELEAQQGLACNAEGLCVAGYSCVKGLCIPGEGRECLEGDTRSCGGQLGECSGGTEVCGSNGRFGSCDTTRVTYGPAYEPQETLCDGKDNDCDGNTDEDLQRACPLTEGVCASAVSTCVQGAWQGCTPDTYLAASGDWQARETLCDGRDNDCDGAVDGSRQELVPASGLPRNATAVPMGDGDAPDVMLAWEQEGRVFVRRVEADGGLGPMRYPSYTVENAVEAWSPAFAPCECNSCNCHIVAWFDRFASCTDPSLCGRLVGAILQPDGSTRVGTNIGKVLPMFGEPNVGRGGALQLVRSNTQVLGVFTVTGASGSSIRLVSCPAALNDLCELVSLGAGDMPTVALSGNGDLATVAWRRDGGLVVADFPLPSFNWDAPSWTTLDVADSSGETEPKLVGDPAVDLRLYSVDGSPADGGVPALVFRAASLPCAGSCTAGLAALSARVEKMESGTDARVPVALAVLPDGGSGEDLLAFQLGSGTTSEVWMATHSDAGWREPTTRVPGQAARPLWVTPDALFLESGGALAKDLACHP